MRYAKVKVQFALVEEWEIGTYKKIAGEWVVFTQYIKFEPIKAEYGNYAKPIIRHHIAWNASRTYRFYAPYVPVIDCSRCRKWFPKEYAKYGGNRLNTPENDLAQICTSCWNKCRPVWKKEMDALQTERTINKLRREIANARKTENRRRDAGISDEHDGRSEERRY